MGSCGRAGTGSLSSSELERVVVWKEDVLDTGGVAVRWAGFLATAGGGFFVFVEERPDATDPLRWGRLVGGFVDGGGGTCFLDEGSKFCGIVCALLIC